VAQIFLTYKRRLNILHDTKRKFLSTIKKFTDWVLQQEVQEDNLEKSLEEMKKKGLYK
jgi:dTDP-L-rhamnose 4-epimerase